MRTSAIKINEMERMSMEKKYKVFGKSGITDFEIDTMCIYDAIEYYEQAKSRGWFQQVYIMNNHTGEVYASWNKSSEGITEYKAFGVV